MTADEKKISGDETIVVTGGAGFIGSAVVRYLVRNTKHTVITLDKLTYAGSRLNLAECDNASQHEFVHGDICDREAVRKLFKEHDVDIVMHLAAESHVDRSIDSPGDFIDTNIVGTYILLEEFRRHIASSKLRGRGNFRFCHVSTDEVFGSLGPDGAFTETSPYDPSSPYSSSKAAADHLARAWLKTYKMPVIVTNCSNNYGPYQHPEKLIPLIILNCIDGKELPIYGDGSNVRDWLYVEDHAAALYRVLSQGDIGETYNIGSRSERTNLEVVETICDIFDELSPRNGSYHDLIRFVPDRPGHDVRYAIDPSKLERDLSWLPEEDFRTGVLKTVNWYIENIAWTQQIDDSRQRRGLGTVAGGAL